MTDIPKTPGAAAPSEPEVIRETRFGDRGDASGRNIEQNRAIEQDDPMEGSRMGRTLLKKQAAGDDEPDEGTDAAQIQEADRVSREKS